MIQISHCASIWPARDLLQLGNDFHAAYLGASGNGAARKHRAYHLPRRHIRAFNAAHIGDNVMHMSIRFQHHQLIHLHAAGHAHPAQIIALQINQHHMLGTLFRMRQQRL